MALGNPFARRRRPGTVGVPFPSTEIRVVDPDDPAARRRARPAGELLIRGPQVFQGYWNSPEETAETLLDGGWLRTGDIVTVDDDGFVTIVDRMKELIITGGFNVSPPRSRTRCARIRDVVDAAVVGLPSAERRRGGRRRGRARATGRRSTPDALRDYCRGRPGRVQGAAPDRARSTSCPCR